MTERRKTYIIDIDGVIFEKALNSTASREWTRESLAIQRSVDFLNMIEKEGACIVLITARRESNRKHLEDLLQSRGVFWDHLIMGAGNGQRILVNDTMDPVRKRTAIGVNVMTNEGISTDDIK